MFGTVNENYDGCSGDWRGGQIVDTVLIPKDIEPGQWILGWRCEFCLGRCFLSSSSFSHHALRHL
eukprot:SAG31_NODE_748_length_12390_cov_6.306484_17_plen_65_part_00